MSFGGSSSFLNGVPMKLSDKFRPLPKIETFYEVPILFPESVLEDEMDLTVENRAINDFMVAQNKIKMENLSRDSSTSNDDGDVVQNSVEEAPETQERCAVVNSPIRTFLPPSKGQPLLQPYINGISSPLQPVPVDSVSFDSPPTTTTASAHKFKNNLLKLEDFENCQSSPFDAVELKTLNVFEELRQVLQGHHAHGHQSVVVTDQQTQSSPSINGHRHVVHNLQ